MDWVSESKTGLFYSWGISYLFWRDSYVSNLYVYFTTCMWVRVRIMVFNATFNNISVISWWSVLLVPGETTDLLQVADKLYHIMLYRVHLDMSEFQRHNLRGNRHCLHGYHMTTTAHWPLTGICMSVPEMDSRQMRLISYSGDQKLLQIR
jgi:hypothetical protein